MNIINTPQNNKYVLLFKYIAPFIIMFFWGFGQIFPYAGWYLHGIALPDILFILYFVFLVFGRAFRAELIQAIVNYRVMVILTLLLVVQLTISTLANYGNNWGVVTGFLFLSIFRTIYFLCIALMISIWAMQAHYRRPMLLLYLVALASVIAWYVLTSYTPESLSLWGTICGRPIIDQRNVVGNLMAVGLLFSALLMLESPAVAVCFAWLFCYCILYTFSKGAWLMGLLGTLCFFLATYFVQRRLAWIFIAVVFAFSLINVDHMACLAYSKSKGTVGSNVERMNFAVRAADAANESILGRGVGAGIREAQLIDDKAKAKAEAADTTGYSSYDNPHSAFLYLLENGGWPALVIYAMLFSYPFYLAVRYGTKPLKLIGIFFALCLGLSGIVQLQIYTQQFYWIIAGFIFAALKRDHREAGVVEPT